MCRKRQKIFEVGSAPISLQCTTFSNLLLPTIIMTMGFLLHCLSPLPMTNVTDLSLGNVRCNRMCAVQVNTGELAGEIHTDQKILAKVQCLQRTVSLTRVAI